MVLWIKKIHVVYHANEDKRDIWATRISKTFELSQLALKYVGLVQQIYRKLTQYDK